MKGNLRMRLDALPKKARAAAFEALREEAVRIGGIMKMRAPRRTGRLANSFKIVFDEARLSVKIQAGGKATTVTARAGIRGIARGLARGGGSYDYSKAVEFGRRGQAAQSFFWPVYRKERRAAKRAIVKKIVGALDQ